MSGESENKARYFVNLSRGRKSIEVSEREWRRISGELLKGHTNNRLIIHEAIEGGVRTHFVNHGEVHSLEERNLESDGWEHLDG